MGDGGGVVFSCECLGTQISLSGHRRGRDWLSYPTKEIVYCQYQTIVQWKCKLGDYSRIRCWKLLEGLVAAHGTLWIFGSLVDSATRAHRLS